MVKYDNISLYIGRSDVKDHIRLSDDLFFVRFNDLSAHLQKVDGTKVGSPFDDSEFVRDFRYLGPFRGSRYFAYCASDYGVSPRDYDLGIIDSSGSERYFRHLDYSSFSNLCESFIRMVRINESYDAFSSQRDYDRLHNFFKGSSLKR